MNGKPENLRMHWVWPSKYKGKWCFSPKCGFSETGHHTPLLLVPLWLACLKTSGCTGVWPSKYKGKWCFSPKCGFSETGHHTALKLVPLWLAHLKTSGCTEFGPLNTKESDVLAQNVVSLKQIIIQLWNLYHCDCTGTPENVSMHWVWPSKYKGKWSFSPKCGFSETGHHTPLLLVPLWLTHLKMSGCTEFGPLNTKESDVFAHNVVSNKQIIIQLWNLYHCDWHIWKLQHALSLAL